MGEFICWSDLAQDRWAAESVFAVKQDTKLLGEFIVKKGGELLTRVVKKRNLDIDSITYFLPHLSSQYFGPRIDKELTRIGLGIPASKWFVNLSKVGNVGAGSAYLMLDELFHSGKLKVGDTLLMMVPESARFNYGWMLFTAV
jgi:3-oxoacyl-[acyl-carrier-protein] synthase-3